MIFYGGFPHEKNVQDAKAVMKNVLKACKKIEPDCEIEL